MKHILILLSLIFPLSMLAQDIDMADPYLLLSDEADRAIAAQDYHEAIARINDAIALRPDAPQNLLLRSNLGMLYSYTDQDSLALVTLDGVLAEAPAMRTVRLNRVRVLLKAGKDATAWRELTGMIEADSLNTEARYLHGLMAYHAGDLTTAKSDFEILEKHDPNSLSTAIALSSLYSSLKQPDKALPHLRRLIKLDPQPENSAALAQALVETGELTEASALIADALKANPDSPELYMARSALNRARYLYKDTDADEQRALQLMGYSSASRKALR